MGRLIFFELFKMCRRPRTYLGTAAFLLICLAVMLGLKYGNLGNMVQRAAAFSGYDGNPVNAAFMAWMVIGSPFVSIPLLTMFMPFFMSLVFGEIFAGESGEGTLRVALTRPISRTGFFAAKLVASLIYALLLVCSLGVVAFLIGWLTFGRGDLLTVAWHRGGMPAVTTFSESQALIRLGLCFLLTTVSMTAVGMIAFFIGVWLNNAMGATGATIMLLFSGLIVGEIEWFHPIKHYLFTTHLSVGQQAFLNPIPWHEMASSLQVLGGYIVVLTVISLVIFRRKDILT